jgi:hypothetical protein
MKTVLSDAAEICVVSGYLVAIFMVTCTAEKSTEPVREVAMTADSDGHITFITAQSGLKLPVHCHILETVPETRTAVHSRLLRRIGKNYHVEFSNDQTKYTDFAPDKQAQKGRETKGAHKGVLSAKTQRCAPGHLPVLDLSRWMVTR